jgi:uncharacterized membrane protein
MNTTHSKESLLPSSSRDGCDESTDVIDLLAHTRMKMRNTGQRIVVIAALFMCSAFCTLRAELVTVEPDDYPDKTDLTAAVQSVQLKVLDDTDQPYGLFTVTANGIAPAIAPTGLHVFGHSDVAFWPSTRRFYAGFLSNVAEVSIKFTGGSGITQERGILKAYDEIGNLLSEYLTSPLLAGQFETMSIVRPEADIAYVIAYTPEAYGNFGKLDCLQFNSTPRAPEISVQQGGNELVNGEAIADYGSVTMGSSSQKSFVIRNVGTANLTNLAMNVSGINAADFSTSGVLPTSLDPGGSANITISYSPKSTGTRDAVFQISSNDDDENPFNILLTGTSLPHTKKPQISVQSGTLQLVNGSSLVSFGAVAVGNTGTPNYITISNIGDERLENVSVSIRGANGADYEIASAPSETILPGGKSSLTLRFSPSTAGGRNASLRITSNDIDQSPFDITLSGMGLVTPAPEIVVLDSSGADLSDGAAIFNFGNSKIGQPVTITATIRNIGTANLIGLSVTNKGENASEFAVEQLRVSTLAPGAHTILTVTFTPKTPGSRVATLHIASNDADENPFDITLSGIGVLPLTPEITVHQGNGANKVLKDNKSSRDFGSVKVGQSSKAMVFTIKNDGKAKLKGLKVALKGTHAKKFKIVKAPAKSIAPGKSTQFKVVFKPSNTKQCRASLRISSNDADENPFRVKLLGKGGK